MKKYVVRITQVDTYTLDIDIEANSAEEAEQLASQEFEYLDDVKDTFDGATVTYSATEAK